MYHILYEKQVIISYQYQLKKPYRASLSLGTKPKGSK